MRNALCVLAVCALFPGATSAQVLKVVEVNAPQVNCVFRPECVITVSDSTGNIGFSSLTPGTAWLQSRTFTSVAGAPAGAGVTGYEYRISLTQASGITDCIIGFNVNFGPHKPLPYKNNQLADVYVVTTGGLGTISVAKAERFGDVIVFSLSKALCLNGPANIANTTYFIGLASTAVPMHVNAQIVATGMVPIYAVDARVPKHDVPPPGGGL